MCMCACVWYFFTMDGVKFFKDTLYWKHSLLIPCMQMQGRLGQKYVSITFTQSVLHGMTLGPMLLVSSILLDSIPEPYSCVSDTGEFLPKHSNTLFWWEVHTYNLALRRLDPDVSCFVLAVFNRYSNCCCTKAVSEPGFTSNIWVLFANNAYISLVFVGVLLLEFSRQHPPIQIALKYTGNFYVLTASPPPLKHYLLLPGLLYLRELCPYLKYLDHRVLFIAKRMRQFTQLIQMYAVSVILLALVSSISQRAFRWPHGMVLVRLTRLISMLCLRSRRKASWMLSSVVIPSMSRISIIAIEIIIWLNQCLQWLFQPPQWKQNYLLSYGSSLGVRQRSEFVSWTWRLNQFRRG